MNFRSCDPLQLKLPAAAAAKPRPFTTRLVRAIPHPLLVRLAAASQQRLQRLCHLGTAAGTPWFLF